jgi:hypothetical protein
MNDFKDKLRPISWLFKNLEFDKSTGTFKNQTDLFTFLEKINRFSYNDYTVYDDFYYILEYTEESIRKIIYNLNYKIIRTHKKLDISIAKEFDSKTISYLSKKPGRTIKEKLKNNKILAVKREKFYDIPENRLFKKFLKKIVSFYIKRDDLNKFSKLYREIHKWLKSKEALLINEKKSVVYNNALMHHKDYHKIFKAYKWLEEYPSKTELYIQNYDKLKKYVLLFELFQQIQYFTSEIVIPQPMNIDFEKFQINLTKQVLLKKLKLTYSNDIIWNDIRKYISDFLQKNDFKINKNKCFYISKEENIYIDLFNLTPFFYIKKSHKINEHFIKKVRSRKKEDIDNEKYIFAKMPLILKQKINKEIVNCNGTKIINLNDEVYTLPDILNSFALEILKLFLKDLKNKFDNMYYIIPDFVNAFEFMPIKKTINAYFVSKQIPESISVVFDNLVDGKYQLKDTIIYISIFNNKVYVSPLLIKYDKNLEKVTNGLYIEKYPTKLLDELEVENLDLIEKFQFNGFKYIIDNNILVIKDNKILSLPSNSIDLKKYKEKIAEIKKIYSNKNLFNSNIFFVFSNEKIAKRLKNLKTIISYEVKGYKVWKEHFPKLSLEVFINGYYDEFILIDENTELKNNIVEISQHFIIPKNIKELNLPLIFEDSNIGFEAYITSSQMPFEEDIECKLILNYNYEAENPYDLEFIPLNPSIKPLRVIWKKQQKTNFKLLYPEFPEKKDWSDLENDKKDNKVSNLLEWVLERLEWLKIDEIPNYIVEKETKENLSSLKKGVIVSINKDKKGNYFYFVRVDNLEKDVFCHSSDFINNNIDFSSIKKEEVVFLNIVKNKKDPTKFNGKNIILTDSIINNSIMENLIKESVRKKLLFLNSKKSFREKTEKLINPLRSIRLPLLKIWSNKILLDKNTPTYFKNKMKEYILLATNLFFNDDTDETAKEELKFFLSAIREDTSEKFFEYLIKISENREETIKNHIYLALSLGDLTFEWQRIIFNNLLKHFKNENYPQFLKILSIAIWRSEKFVFYLEKDVIFILQYLLFNLKKIFSIYQSSNDVKYKKTLTSLLELLLGILMLRKINPNLLNPNVNLTKSYIRLINKIIKFFVINKINIDSRIEIEVIKSDEMKKIPDLLYILEVYLRNESNDLSHIKLKGIIEK